MALTQMNTRIDAKTKRLGDAVFERMGLSPSEVVRIVWEYAVEHGAAPAIVQEALTRKAEDAPSIETAFRTAIAEQSCNLVAGYRQRIGASAPNSLDAIDYRMMREQAWSERLSERGLA